MTKSKIPTEWHEEHRTGTVDGQQAIDGFLSGGDLVGTYVSKDGVTLLTISTARAEWLVRVMLPGDVQFCLEAALAAAEKGGVVER